MTKEQFTFDLNVSEIRDLVLLFNYDPEHDSFDFTNEFWQTFNEFTKTKVGLSLKYMDEPWKSFPHKNITTEDLVRSMKSRAIPVVIPRLSLSCVEGRHVWSSDDLRCRKCGLPQDHKVGKVELFEHVLVQVRRNIALMSGIEIQHITPEEMANVKKIHNKYKDVINFLVRVEGR
jgi:hypothetical protein